MKPSARRVWAGRILRTGDCAAARAGRVATRLRLARGRPRAVWGVTPILTIQRLAACDRLLGVEGRSLVYQTYATWRDFDIDLERISGWLAVRHPVWALLVQRLVFWWALVRFDFFHLFCDRGLLPPEPGHPGIHADELEALSRGGKRLYTYTYGADVRTRRRTEALGQYHFCLHCPEPGRYCVCDDEKGQANIGRIEAYATTMLAMGDMVEYVPNCRRLAFWPIHLAAFPHVGVRPSPRPLRIAHVTNQPFFKGTTYLTAAVDRLRRDGVEIELLHRQGVGNDDVLRLLSDADLLAEQFLGGFHGYTALEAMALGKPVLSYLRPGVDVVDAARCPIISTTPETLEQTLRECATGRMDLAAIGARGRSYVERNFTLEAVAARLGRLYLETASLPARLRRALHERVTDLEQALAGIDRERRNPVP